MQTETATSLKSRDAALNSFKDRISRAKQRALIKDYLWDERRERLTEVVEKTKDFIRSPGSWLRPLALGMTGLASVFTGIHIADNYIYSKQPTTTDIIPRVSASGPELNLQQETEDSLIDQRLAACAIDSSNPAHESDASNCWDNYEIQPGVVIGEFEDSLPQSPEEARFAKEAAQFAIWANENPALQGLDIEALPRTGFFIVTSDTGEITARQLDALAKTGTERLFPSKIHPNLIPKGEEVVVATSSDQNQNPQWPWYLQRIGIPTAQEFKANLSAQEKHNQQNASPILIVDDTGFNLDRFGHLVNIVGGKNVLRMPRGEICTVDDWGSCDDDYRKRRFGFGLHGNIVTLLAAGGDNIGANPDLDVFVIKHLNSFGDTTDASHILGLEAIREVQAENPDRRIILNISWVLDQGEEFPLEQEYAQFAQNGILAVFAAGNTNLLGVRRPASLGGGLVVGGSNINDERYFNSAIGPQVDILYPSDDIYIPRILPDHKFRGTSFGAPLAAGALSNVIPLLNLTPQQAIEVQRWVASRRISCEQAYSNLIGTDFFRGCGRAAYPRNPYAGFGMADISPVFRPQIWQSLSAEPDLSTLVISFKSLSDLPPISPEITIENGVARFNWPLSPIEPQQILEEDWDNPPPPEEANMVHIKAPKGNWKIGVFSNDLLFLPEEIDNETFADEPTEVSFAVARNPEPASGGIPHPTPTPPTR